MSKEIHYCDVCGISSEEKRVNFIKNANMYLCRKHREQFMKFGEFKDSNPRGVFDPNAQMEETLFHYSGDATQAYKNWKAKQTKGITEREVKEFMLEYLAKKSKNCPGSGYLITVESAVADTRERPYKIDDVKNEEGKRVWKKQYKWIDRETQTVVCSVDTNKADAKNALKELYKSGEYRGDADLFVVKDVEKGQPIVATAKYTPSKNTKNGTWIAFGIEA